MSAATKGQTAPTKSAPLHLLAPIDVLPHVGERLGERPHEPGDVVERGQREGLISSMPAGEQVVLGDGRVAALQGEAERVALVVEVGPPAPDLWVPLDHSTRRHAQLRHGRSLRARRRQQRHRRAERAQVGERLPALERRGRRRFSRRQLALRACQVVEHKHAAEALRHHAQRQLPRRLVAGGYSAQAAAQGCVELPPVLDPGSIQRQVQHRLPNRQLLQPRVQPVLVCPCRLPIADVHPQGSGDIHPAPEQVPRKLKAEPGLKVGHFGLLGLRQARPQHQQQSHGLLRLRRARRDHRRVVHRAHVWRHQLANVATGR
mmetsp:Transcript_37754/g.121374  ORF Transcript_37754/g.121374 Transcript_37754/m.121374 type:complete len:318 (+) Transcript_37754:77-1030(+)